MSVPRSSRVSWIARALAPVLASATFAVWPARAAAPLVPIPDDPLYDSQYGLTMIRAADAWRTTTGTGVVVAVIDTGVDLDHPDLDGSLVAGVTLIGCDEGCGTGDWESGGDPRVGESEHGTHVAGIIAAEADNGIGIAGVAPGARVLPIKAGQSGGFQTEDLATAIRWATDHGAGVVNLSLGRVPGTTAFDVLVADPLVEALRHAADHDVLVVAAAGNGSLPVCEEPAIIGSVLCVVAVDPNEAPAAYTGSGVKPGLLALAAPGGARHEGGFSWATDLCDAVVVSTWPVGFAEPLYEAACGWDPGHSYQGASGTSMAAPHVAGVAALVRSLGCSASVTSDVLLATARQPVTATRGAWNPVYGHGIVDAAEAVLVASERCSPESGPVPFAPDPCLRWWREPFDGGALPDGWIVETSDNTAGTPAWHPVSDPRNGSGVFTDASGPGRKDDALWSPAIAAGARTQLRFEHRYLFRGTIRTGADGGRLEVSVDGGPPQPVPARAFRRHPYSGEATAGTDSPLAGSPAWVAAQGESILWGPRYADPLRRPEQVVVDLSSWAGHEVRAVWRLGQNTDSVVDAFSLDPGVGWTIDGVEVVNERAGC